MDKYKEIINKGTDSSTKSQQYLDGLLRIPFGVYCREPILLQRLSELKTEFTHLVSQDTSESGFTDGSLIEPVMNSAIEKYIKTTKCFANTDEILLKLRK